jgi:hypothetical protein
MIRRTATRGARRAAPTARGYPRTASRRPLSWSGPLAVLLVLVGVFATGLGLGRATDGAWNWLASADREPPREFPVMAPSRPIRLAIPDIGVRAAVRGVGLAEDGSIDVPDITRHQETGWYERGPTPGQFGSAIIVGHVDSAAGPSVFHRLGDLRPGAIIEVTRRDRSVAIFEVNSVERFPKEALPAERVYGDYSRPHLRLITCGGRWVGGSLGYTDNVVAFASLVRVRAP